MTTAWMLYVLLVGVLLVVAAWGMEDVLRCANLPTRWAWAAAMLGTIAFAGYGLAGIAPAAPAVTTLVEIATAPSAARIVRTSQFTAAVVAARELVSRLIALVSSRIPAGIARAALIAWMLSSAVLLLVHVAVNRRVIRQRRSWPLATIAGGTVRVAPTLGPAVVGLASPEIVVPRWLLEKSGDEQRLVMLHEKEHIAARDQYLPVAALVVATLLPWHPAVWWALARMRLAVELDCDARVLRRGIHAQRYGSLLIDIAGQCAGHRVGALALADRPSHLERRLLAMTDRTFRFPLARSAGLSAIAALAILTACEARLPTSSQLQAMDVASAEKALVQSKVMDERAAANVVYVVNGATVSADKAHAIPSNHIASVNIVKGGGNTADPRATVVHIVTSDSVLSPLPRKSEAEGEARGLEARPGTVARAEFSGQLYIDGVLAPEGAMAKLSPNDIVSVNILKGEAARAFSSDPAAANGVIQVVTKAAAKSH